MATAQTIYPNPHHCPFSNNPFENCATKVISGSSIASISRYCMGNFKLCPVFESKKDFAAIGISYSYVGETIIQKEGKR